MTNNNTAEAMVMDNEIRNSFTVRADKLEWLNKQFASLAKRAAKVGCEAPRIEIGSSFLVTEKTRRGVEVVVEKVNVDVVGVTPHYNGWTFAATLQHLHEGGACETVIRNVSIFEAPESYRNAGPDCEHCNYKRRRNDTYLVVSDAGEWKQVGSTCVEDFLGGKGLDALARQADLISEAMGTVSGLGSDDVEGGSTGYSIRYFVAACYAQIEQDGRFVGRTRAREEGGTSTADAVLNSLSGVDGVAMTEANFARASSAVEWVLGLQDEGLTEFLHNLRAVCRSGYVTFRLAGYAAAVCAAYDRHDREQAAARDSRSTHVGEIGAAMPACRVRVRSVKDMTAKGWGYLVTVIGADYCLRSFFSKEPLNVGECYTVAGTVRDHRSDNGIPVTALTRVKVTK